MFCDECGSKFDDGATFCGECGNPRSVDKKSLRCSGCAGDIHSGEAFCAGCGLSTLAITKKTVTFAPFEEEDDSLFGSQPLAQPPPSLVSAAPPEPPIAPPIAPPPPLKEEQVYGDGAGIAVVDQFRVKEQSHADFLSSQTIKKNISQQLRETSVSSSSYVSTRFGENLTLHQNPSEVHSAPPTGQATDSLDRFHQHYLSSATTFEDDEFRLPGTCQRLNEVLSRQAFVMVTMYDDDKYLVCGIAIKSADQIREILATTSSSNTNSKFETRARQVVESGIHGRKKENLLYCTTALLTFLTEFEPNATVNRLTQLYQIGLIDSFQPLFFRDVQQTTTVIDTNNVKENYKKRVSVVVTLRFAIDQICLNMAQSVTLHQSNQLSDSYLLGSLSLLSPHQRTALFPLLPNGSPQTYHPSTRVYCVAIWSFGRLYYVVIDDLFPTIPKTNQLKYANFTCTNTTLDISVMLIEKAFAKFYNRSYDNLNGGQLAHSLQDLTNDYSITHEISEDVDENEVWQLLTTSLQSSTNLIGCLVSCTSSFEWLPPVNCVVTLLQCLTLSFPEETVRLVQLKNSWYKPPNDGNRGFYPSLASTKENSWQWNREDIRWRQLNRQQKTQIDFDEDNTEWMELSLFCRLFSQVIVSQDLISMCLQNRSNQIDFIYSGWSHQAGTAGGRTNLHLNPQYFYTVQSPLNESHKLHCYLEQPSRRFQSDSSGQKMDYEVYLNCLLATCDEDESKKRKIDLAHSVVKTKNSTFVGNRSNYLTYDCDKKNYVLIPCTYESEQSRPFRLTVFRPYCDSRIETIDDTATLARCHSCHCILECPFRTFNKSNHVCLKCVDSYQQSQLPTCAQCQLPISGQYHTFNKTTNVHTECLVAYQISQADRCGHCQEPILKTANFSGKFFRTGDDKQHKAIIHSECWQSYQSQQAEKCYECREPILNIPNKFSGKFYKLPDHSDQKVHFECWQAYQNKFADKCKHCHLPILKTEGKFDGRFYELNDKSGKVHFECWDQFQRAN